METRVKFLFCLHLTCSLTFKPPDVVATPASGPTPTAAAGSLRIIGMPVGQGDGIVIVCPERNGNVIIFDLGSVDELWSADEVKTWLLSQTINGDRDLLSRVSTVIISHPHADHFNYLPKVLVPNKATGVFVGGLLKAYNGSALGYWLNNKNVRAREFNGGKRCVLDDCKAQGWTNRLCGETSEVKFNVLAANYGNKTNEMSVVLRVELGNISTLLTGDFEGKEAQEGLISDLKIKERGELLRSTIYKVSHHGASKLANFPSWLEAIQAKWAFFSSTHPSRRYGHPNCETIKRLQRVGSLGNTGVGPHEIDCSSSKSKYVQEELTVNIYTTRPTESKVCIIWFDIGKQELNFLWKQCQDPEETLDFTREAGNIGPDHEEL